MIRRDFIKFSSLALGGFFMGVSSGETGQGPLQRTADFEGLKNQRGETVTNSDFDGKYSIGFLGFVDCGDICPLTKAALMESLRIIEHVKGKDFMDRHIRPFMLSIAPGDKPEDMRKHFKDTLVLGLTGDKRTIGKAAKSLGVTVDFQGPPIHDSLIRLLGRGRRLMAEIPSTLKPAQIAGQLMNAIDKDITQRIAPSPGS